MNNKSSEKRSDHITYAVRDHSRIHKALLMAIKRAAFETGVKASQLKMVDFGCGRGDLMYYLQQEGIKVCKGVDFDENCVQMASEYGEVILSDLTDIKKKLPSGMDLAIFSHSIEHMRDPQKIIEDVIDSFQWFLFAIPNPIRPNVIKFALKKYDYSNLGHYYCWDRSHFKNFLKNYCELDIVSWYTDDILLPSKILRKVLKYIGLLERFETKILPKHFPYFSTSIIVLCRNNLHR